MIQLSEADTAFDQCVLICTLNSSLLTVIPYFGVLRVVHEHCSSSPKRTKLGHKQCVPHFPKMSRALLIPLECYGACPKNETKLVLWRTDT